MGLGTPSTGGAYANPAGAARCTVHADSGDAVGDVRRCDDGRYEAIGSSGRFAGVHRTLSEAIQALTDP